ncbi:MAG: class I SAM-dependent methyltransferase [Acidimicrobiales bacterium]|nr:class I SAM-dependent methyltransferase [Acidimicrobiales bacterium]MCB1259272.1 class I SAM-dependent methyltransferase [Acidimicrobiales bacterium]
MAGGADAAGGAEPDWLVKNRAAWDERVPIHVASSFYDVDRFVAGRNSLRDFEVAEVATAGGVAGRSLVHLQCHFGQDTLSWARLGARVTGVDFAPSGIDAARTLAERAGVPGEFVCAEVYDAPAALGGRTFDVVYTGLGALVWLPDIASWGRVVADLLAPGGFCYLAEFHPVVDVFDDDRLVATRPYFTVADGDWSDTPGSYVDWDAATTHNETVEWTHPVSSVVSALLDAGLVLEQLHEHGHTLFERWPFLERRADGTYHLPSGSPSLPLMYSLVARRPA